MAIESREVKISTTGSAGSASGSAVAPLPLCELLAVYLDYHASAPATTDVTITASGNPLAVTLLTRSNSATDAWLYPKVQDHDNTGAAITGSYSHPVIHNNLSISIAQADALTDCLIVTLYYRV